MAITNLPPVPDRNDTPDDFANKGDAFFAALPTFVTQTNAALSGIDADVAAASASASSATLSASEATNSAQVSAANANFKGLWSTRTGAATVPYSVYHNNKFWRLIVSLADVTASEPSSSNSDWKEAVAVGEIRTPLPVAPLSGATAVVPAPTLEASAYAPLYSVDDRLHRRFEVSLATDPAFATPVYTAEVNANSVTVSPTLALETAHIWRCKDVVTLPDATTIESDWMGTQSFTTANITVNEPVLTVEGSPSSVPESPTLTTSAFDTTPTGEDTHAATDWEVRKTSDNTLVFSSLSDAVNLLSIVVPAGNLDPNTSYLFKARHIGTTYGSGPYAEVTATTLETFDVVPLLAVGHDNLPYITVYNQEIDTFTKLADPSTLPTGPARGKVAFSSDDTYMAVGHNTSPFITIYKRSVDTFTKLADPATLPTGNSTGVAFSSDTTYLAVSYATSPYISIYKRSGDTFTKLADPSSLPTGPGYSVAFSSDNTYLAVGHDVSPFIAIYKRSGDTFTKLADPATLPTNNSNSVAFSSSTTYLAVAHSTAPYLTIYKRSGDTFTKLADPSSLPTNNSNGVAFSSDDTYMAVAYNNAPYIIIYKRSGDTFTKLADPADVPANSGISVAFSSDTTYMAVGWASTPFITIYKRSGDTFTKLADPSTLPTGVGRSVAFSNTGFPQ